MKIEQLIKRLDDYSGLSCNSKDVYPGNIFVAVKGSCKDGNKFVKEAVTRGASVIVSNLPATPALRNKALFLKVKDSRQALAELASAFYGYPSKKIKTVGVTGTNGKTTITYLIEAVLKKCARNSGVIGTVNYRFGNKIIASKNTTPGPIELQRILSEMQKIKTEYVLMEVSSHALDQVRAAGINFHSAIFTNLTQDHLDYHKTMRAYFLAKAKLFQGLSSKAFCVLNEDDPWALKLKKLTRARIITYGIKKNADFTAGEIKLSSSHTEFSLLHRKKMINFRIPLIGKHNVYNALAVIAWAAQEGIALESIRRALENFQNVPGRLERINSAKDFLVFVDYAHTEDALKNVINALRQNACGKKIIVVFGCGGERDKEKRPKMGRVVSTLADYAIITNDNPRSEAPERIINDIKRGINKDNYFVEPDRFKAIRKSLSLADKGDIVLLAGKGHEDYQILGNKRIHFDDREVARKCLTSMSS